MQKNVNTLVDSPKPSLMRTSAPAPMSVIVPINDLEEGSEEELEGHSESESDSLSFELGSIATQPSMQPAATSMTKDSIEIELVLI